MVELDFTDELAIVRGDDFVYTFEFQDENCDPIDQTGSIFDATITRNGVVLETFAVLVTGNSVRISLTEAETLALQPVSKAKWRLRQTVSSVTTTIISGDVTIRTI